MFSIKMFHMAVVAVVYKAASAAFFISKQLY